MSLVPLVDDIFQSNLSGGVDRRGVDAVIGADRVAGPHFSHIKGGVTKPGKGKGVIRRHPEPHHQAGESLSGADLLLHHVKLIHPEPFRRKRGHSHFRSLLDRFPPASR